MPDRLLTVQEGCEYLRVSRATFYRLAKDGSVPLRKVRGRTVVQEAALARVPRRPVRSRGKRRAGRPARWLERWIDALIRSGLVPREDRRKFLSPHYEDVEPIKVKGIPLSELIIRERREGW